MSDHLISKTVRLPVYLVEFIEAQEGSTFTEKLQGVLNDARCGDSDYQIKLTHYKRQVERFERLYSDLVKDYDEARSAITKTEVRLDRLRRLAAKELRADQESSVFKPRSPDTVDPDLIPGNMPFT